VTGTIAERGKGMTEQVAGRVEAAAGKVVGSEKMEADGKAKERIAGAFSFDRPRRPQKHGTGRPRLMTSKAFDLRERRLPHRAPT
jgi:hypothetical protein